MTLGVSAYSLWIQPPVRERLHPSLVMRYVPGDADLLDAWRAAGASQLYWRPNILLAGRRDGKLRSLVGRLAAAMSKFAQAGVVQTDFDSIIHNWSVHGVNYYAAARLTWDPTLPASTIIQDFTQSGFGAGASAMQRYIELAEAADGNYTPDRIAQLRTLLNETDAAANDPQVTRRVEFLRLGLNYTDLSERLNDLVKRHDAGETIDREQAKRLGDLHAMGINDLMVNQPLAINIPYLCMISGRFNPWYKIGGPGPIPSDPALLQRLDDPAHRLTGREQSIDAMFAVYGLK